MEKKISEIKLQPSSQQSFIKERQRILEASQMSNGSLSTKKMENALNDWLEKVEEQVNMLDERIQEKVSIYDIQQIDLKLQQEIKDR